MIFNFIRAYLNQEKVIKTLSNSYPIRMTARLIVRNGFKVMDTINDLTLRKNIIQRKNIFLKTFKEEFKKNMKN
uniref:N-acetyltransferase n=1 Tax=Strongyloides stercoralis TaxID=6248 RepID=A0A0K0ELT2_STRER